MVVGLTLFFLCSFCRTCQSFFEFFFRTCQTICSVAEHQNMNRARHTNDKLQTFDWGDIKCPSFVENVPTHFGECRHSGGDFTPSDPSELLFRRVGVGAFSSSSSSPSSSSFVKIYPQ
jgi:hypothetical protein